MAIGAFPRCPDSGRRKLRFGMTELEISPAATGGKALRVLDAHLGAGECTREKAPSRRLRARAIRIFLGLESELQLLVEHCLLREDARLFVDRVRSRLDIYVVILRECRLSVIKRIGSQWRADIDPIAVVFGKNQFAR